MRKLILVLATLAVTLPFFSGISGDETRHSAVREFIVTADDFTFFFSPAPFVVNQGDTVTLRITSRDVVHSFFLERYMSQPVTLVPNRTETVQFVATEAGTFRLDCLTFCGSGHFTMNGVFTVNAATAPPAPVLTNFTPAGGSTAGGNVVVITGSNFVNNATVRFGDTAAIGVSIDSATRITAFAPARSAGGVTITVTNPDGQSAASATQYTYVAPTPGTTNRRRAVRR